jgi:hypothetical protein
MKQFVKAIDSDDESFAYLSRKFSRLGTEKLEAGIFDGVQIRHLIKDPNFVNSMNELEPNAWRSFVSVLEIFLGNHRSDDNFPLIERMLTSLKSPGCNMSIKLHYLHSHLNHFPENQRFQ